MSSTNGRRITDPPGAAEPEPDDRLPVDPDAAAGERSGWDVVLVVAAGGALGSLARWALREALPPGADGFPWSTFLENVSGGFALGVLMVFVIDVWRPSRYVRPFFGVGVLGGFTTFSTYMVDTRALVADGRAPLAAAYLFGTLAVGVAAVWLGIALARRSVGQAAWRKERS